FSIEYVILVLGQLFGLDVDGSAERLGVLFGQIRVGNGNRADQTSRYRIEGDRTAASGWRRVVGGQQAHAVERGAVQVVVDAADVDVAAFAGVGFQRDSGQPAHRFARIHVGKPFNFLGRLNQDQVRCEALLLACGDSRA